jgi:uroporphyrin-III C-methyltransferase/precorrin-2 dehydrogenase/sirohydrochlorin ferrochelatase
MPIVIASRISQAGERRIATTLDVLAEPSTELGLTGPALLIVGEVAGLDMAGLVERLTHRTVHSTSGALAYA